MSMDPSVLQSQTAIAGQRSQAQVPLTTKTSTDTEKQGYVAFNDVAIYFLREEWTLLDSSQRHLYHHVMMEVFVLMSSLGLIPYGTSDITQLESSGDPFIPPLRFLTPRVEVEKMPCEQNTSMEGELTIFQQQQLSCAEKSLQRTESRIPVVKNKKRDLSGERLHSTENGMDLQIPSDPLGHHVTHGSAEPPRSTKRKKTIHSKKSNGKSCDCGKSFTCKTIHSKKGNCKCCDCGKSFTCKSLLIRHRRTHTGEKPFKCTDCEKSFIQKADLNQHVKVHTGEKPFRCSECGKDLKHNRSLVGHQRLHTGERPYKCSHCGESYMNKSSLIRHNRIHTGEKPYKCTECGKLYRERSSLVYHFRVHTGERPFKCSECGKCFKKNSHLVKHRKVHSRGKPFKCNVCGRSFTVRCSLIKHQRFHTAAKHHECKECGKVFCYRTGLYRHRKTHTE